MCRECSGVCARLRPVASRPHRIKTIDVVKRQFVGVEAQLGSKFGQNFWIRL